MLRWFQIVVFALALGGCASSSKSHPDRLDSASTIRDGQGSSDRGADVARDATASAALRLGALSDVHGDLQALESLVTQLAAKGVSFVVLLGDLAADRQAIVKTVEVVARAGLPVYVLPGNYERRVDFAAAMVDLGERFGDRVVDLSAVTAFTRQTVRFVALGGYHDPRWVGEDCFRYGEAELQRVASLLGSGEAPDVLLTHGPPQSSGTHGIDYVPGAGNVGDPALKQLIEQHEVAFSISGHIHEAGQRAVDAKDRALAAGQPANKMLLNAAAVRDGKASLVTIAAGQMSFTALSAP